MDWTQVMTILGGNIALFLWSVRQSRSDFFHLDKKIEDNRREHYQLMKTIQEQFKDFQDKIIKLENGDDNKRKK